MIWGGNANCWVPSTMMCLEGLSSNLVMFPLENTRLSHQVLNVELKLKGSLQFLHLAVLSSLVGREPTEHVNPFGPTNCRLKIVF